MSPRSAFNHWLCPEDGYGVVASELCQADPRLRERNRPSEKRNIPLQSNLREDAPRVAILRQDPHGKFIRETMISDLEDLEQHFLARKAANSSNDRILYLLEEGLHPKIVHQFGTFFNIHPSFFANHQRTARFRYHRRQGGGNDIMLQPTLACNNSYAMLWYHEVLCFDPQPPGLAAFCARTRRSLLFSRADPVELHKKRASRIGRAARKSSIWSRTSEGGGWDCVILCDPPVKRILLSDSETNENAQRVTTTPYQGGYVDFRGQEDQLADRSGPSRASLLDDLCFYLERNFLEVADTSSPILPMMVLQKLIVSHYVKLIHYMGAVLRGRHYKSLSYGHRLSLLTEEVRNQWADIQRWERLAFEYCEDMENNLITLGITSQSPDTSKPFSLEQGNALDFQFVFMRLKRHYERIQKLNNSMTGLAQMASSEQSWIAARRSVREAKSVKALTVVGLIFIPLGYISSLFGMEGQFAPGGQRFREIWAVSLPLVAVVVLSYFILDLGYDYEGDWSWGSFKDNFPFFKGVYARSGLNRQYAGDLEMGGSEQRAQVMAP